MIDDSLPFILNILLANFVGLLGIAVVLSYVQVVGKTHVDLMVLWKSNIITNLRNRRLF